jgi:hypothetical protein
VVSSATRQIGQHQGRLVHQRIVSGERIQRHAGPPLSEVATLPGAWVDGEQNRHAPARSSSAARISSRVPLIHVRRPVKVRGQGRPATHERRRADGAGLVPQREQRVHHDVSDETDPGLRALSRILVSVPTGGEAGPGWWSPAG